MLENVSKSCKNLPNRWPDCVHVQSFHRSQCPSSVHVARSQHSYCVLQRSPAILPWFLATLIRSSSVQVQSSASLYRLSSVRLMTTSQFILKRSLSYHVTVLLILICWSVDTYVQFIISTVVLKNKTVWDYFLILTLLSPSVSTTSYIILDSHLLSFKTSHALIINWHSVW